MLPRVINRTIINGLLSLIRISEKSYYRELKFTFIQSKINLLTITLSKLQK